MLIKVFSGLSLMGFSLQAVAHGSSHAHSHSIEPLLILLVLIASPWMYRAMKRQIVKRTGKA